MNKQFFINNREKLADKMEDNSIAIFFAGNAPQKSADENYTFTPNRNFFYLTGINEENVIFLLSKKEGKTEHTLFIREADPVLEKWVGKTISSKEATEASGIATVEFISGFESKLYQLANSGCYGSLYLNLEMQGYSDNNSKAHKFAADLSKRFPYLKIQNIAPVIASLRVIKAEQEIELTREAISITKTGIEALMKNANGGMMEYELEAHFDFILKSNGIKDHAFPTIAASGKNAAILHYNANDSKIGEQDLILFDLGAQYGYYNADITRTFPVSGKFTERQKTLYNIVLKAELEIINMIEPGVPFKALNERCREILAEECEKIGLIKNKDQLSDFYFHGVSHYLGLDTHDVGSRDLKLEPGMLLTVEPGLYIEAEEIGIRIEDNVLVTETGREVLSKEIIKTVEEIESFMEKR